MIKAKRYCSKCGRPISFAFIDGKVRPIHDDKRPCGASGGDRQRLLPFPLIFTRAFEDPVTSGRCCCPTTPNIMLVHHRDGVARFDCLIWGEWHSTHPAPVAVRKQIVDMYLQAFPKTPLVFMSDDVEVMGYALAHGAGILKRQPSVRGDGRLLLLGRGKKRILRCALTSIVAEIVEDPPRVKLLLHWAGGVHTSVFVKRNRTGEHGRCTDREVVQLVRELAGSYNDRVIAQVLNKLGYTTGVGNSFNLCRVQSLRNYHQIPCFDDSKRDWLTLEETAERLDVSQATARKLLQRGILKGRQIVKYAPWMIGPDALKTPSVQAAVARVQSGHAVPLASDKQSELLLQPQTGEV
jgi:hypothetical protein